MPDGADIQVTPETFTDFVKALATVLGISGTEHSGGKPRKTNDPLPGREWALAADQMLRDDQVALALGVVESEVLGAVPEIIAGGDGTPEGDRFARELAQAARELFGVQGESGLIRRPFDAWCADIVRPMLHYGAMPMEVEWDPLDFRSGRSIPIDIHQRLPSSIESWGEGDTLGPITQRWVSGSAEPKPMDAHKVLLFTLGRLGTDWMGLGLGRAAWAPWQRRKDLQDIRQIGIERFGMTPPQVMQDRSVLTPGSAENLSKIESLIADQVDAVSRVTSGDGSVIVSVRGVSEVDFGTETGFKADGVLAAESEEVTCIHSAFGTAFMRMGINGEGNRSLGEVHMGLLRRAASRYADLIAAVFNGLWRPGAGLIGAFIRLNWGAVDPRLYPRLVFTGLEPNALAEALGSLPGLVTAGLLTPDDETEGGIRTVLDLPPLAVGRSPEERLLAGSVGAAAPVFSALARIRGGRSGAAGKAAA